ncbi:MAG: PilN domain-containing protein [Thermodesulfobacteriota bacterium]
MIKINLLKVRKEKKKIGLRKEMIVFLLSMGVVLGLLFVALWFIGSEKEKTVAQIARTKKEIEYYKSLRTEFEKAKEQQKVLQEKLNVINLLRKEKASPARVLDTLCIDKPEKVYFESVKKDGSKLGIEGVALDDETVANFMTNLRKSKLFRNVDLIVTEQVEISKIPLKKFILSCEIIFM